MKKWIIGLVAGGALAAGGFALFADDINSARAALEYQGLFKPDVIDENFRTMYEKYSSVKVSKGDAVYELPENFHDDALPLEYEYEGETKNLKDFLKNTQATGVAVLHKGKLVYEMYDRGNTRESRCLLMSVSKSMASFLIGVAYEAGDIESLNDQVIKYVPSLKGSAYDGATVQDVLEMSSGARWDEDYSRIDSDIVQSIIASKTGSLDAFTASVPREFEPGTYNRYSSIDTHALGMILRGATGKPYRDYFEEKLWSRLGAEDDMYLQIDAVGEPIAYGGVNARLRDMVRFGKLYLDGGVNHKGERLVSENWIKTSTTPDSPRLAPGANNPQSSNRYGYKYQWWTPHHPDGEDFMALGIYGQFIYVNPARDVVIARTSAYQDFTVDGGYMLYETIVAFQQVARYLSPDSDES
ncbi:MAG: serine hydrolase [Pseudomonadota bacterium]